MFENFKSIPIDKLIVLSISGVNILATGYVFNRPNLEDKLFELYTGSVIGLYSGRVLQQRSESNYPPSKRENERDGNL